LHSHSSVIIRNHLIFEMIREANRTFPRETGGILLGLRNPIGASVVTAIVGPGPRARHGFESFTPDYDFQEREIAALHVACRGNLMYLGDWHTHPLNKAYLSEKDLLTMERIGSYEPASCPCPVMIILAGGRPWQTHAWGSCCSGRTWWGKRLPKKLQVVTSA
jgi:integrative and conjugative element protein (TIGR02256 family)